MKKHALTVIGVLALGLGLYAVWLYVVACPTEELSLDKRWATGTHG